MSTTIRKMDTQLKTWRDRIERQAAQDPQRGVPAGVTPTQHFDKLRALHAAALKEFTGFRAADAEARADLKPRTVKAWNALAAAVKSPRPTT